MEILKIYDNPARPQWADLTRRCTRQEGEIAEQVAGILAQVREGGDEALRRMNAARQAGSEALPLAGRFYLTRVRHPYEGDTRFPAWDESEWRLAASEAFPCGASYPWPFVFETWERR